MNSSGHLDFSQTGGLYLHRAQKVCHKIKALDVWVFRSKVGIEQPSLGERIKRPLQKRGVSAFENLSLQRRYDESTSPCVVTVFGILWVKIRKLRRRDNVNPERLSIKIVKFLKHWPWMLSHSEYANRPHATRQVSHWPPRGWGHTNIAMRILVAPDTMRRNAALPRRAGRYILQGRSRRFFKEGTCRCKAIQIIYLN